MTSTPEFLTVEEAAELVRVSPSSIYEQIRRGLPARKCGKQWRIRRVELDAWFGGSASIPSLAHAIAPIVAEQVSLALAEAMAEVAKALKRKRV